MRFSDMTAELADLKTKIDRVESFGRSDEFNELHQDDKTLLLRQFEGMCYYHAALERRIDKFKKREREIMRASTPAQPPVESSYGGMSDIISVVVPDATPTPDPAPTPAAVASAPIVSGGGGTYGGGGASSGWGDSGSSSGGGDSGSASVSASSD